MKRLTLGVGGYKAGALILKRRKQELPPSGGKTTMRNIVLSNQEYQYLLNDLLKHHEEIIEKINLVSKNDNVEIALDDDTTYNIWQLAADNVALHFDENYEPTKEGWILEHFIDKFYF